MQKIAMPYPYSWVLDRGLAGREPFTALQPWFFLADNELFIVGEKWPNGPCKVKLCAFARRQDCDTIACFAIESPAPFPVIVVEGWASKFEGYAVLQEFESFWDWMKSVFDDIAEWCAQ